MWLKDPTNNLPSATLTLWVMSVMCCFIGAGLHMTKLVEHTSILLELNWGLAALYLGRRIDLSGKNYKMTSNSKKKD
jgi:hypothetical protein